MPKPEHIVIFKKIKNNGYGGILLCKISRHFLSVNIGRNFQLNNNYNILQLFFAEIYFVNNFDNAFK